MTFLMLSPVAFAQDEQRFEVSGWVVDTKQASAVQEATVFIEELQRQTVSDRQGRFGFEGLAAGSYTLRIEHEAFELHQERIVLPDDAARAGELYIELRGLTGVSEYFTVTTSSSPLRNPVSYRPEQAFDAEALQRRAGNSLGEMLDGEPGIAMRSFGPAPTRPVIRGMDGERVLVLENGERMGDLSGTAHDHAVTFDPLAIDRVEVIRGPAGLLYGSGALGGVVNILNEDIPRHWAPGLYGDVGLHGASVNTAGAAGGRLIYGSESWAATARISAREAGELSTPQGALEGTHLSQLTGSTGLGFSSGRLQGGLSAGALSNSYGLPEQFETTAEGVEIRSARQNIQGRLNWEREGFADNIELRFHGSRYHHQEMAIERRAQDADVEQVELDFMQLVTSSTLTVRHRNLGPIDQGAIGFNVVARDIVVSGEDGLTPDSRTYFLAAFVFEEIPLTERIRLQFGVRPELHLVEPRPNAHFTEPAHSRAQATLSGSVGLNIRPADFLEFGTQAAQAHRAPMIEELYSRAAHLGTGKYEIGDPQLESEIGRGIDAYTRMRFGRVSLELAAFYQRVDNYVFLEPTGQTDAASGYPIYAYQSSESDFRGFESQAKVGILAGLELSAGVDYVRAMRLDTERTPLPAIPPLRARLKLGYEAESFWLGTLVRLVGAQTRTAPEELPTEGYALLGFDAGYRFHAGGLHVLSVRLDNTLNTVYRDHLSRVEGREVVMPGRSANAMYRWVF
ncbi:MAG: TonB-dependent receptor [Bradymonadaceae bacterium]|nr:TonB-dependent receptor [Lujinxingiaceae bacterium]